MRRGLPAAPVFPFHGPDWPGFKASTLSLQFLLVDTGFKDPGESLFLPQSVPGNVPLDPTLDLVFGNSSGKSSWK